MTFPSPQRFQPSLRVKARVWVQEARSPSGWLRWGGWLVVAGGWFWGTAAIALPKPHKTQTLNPTDIPMLQAAVDPTADVFGAPTSESPTTESPTPALTPTQFAIASVDVHYRRSMGLIAPDAIGQMAPDAETDNLELAPIDATERPGSDPSLPNVPAELTPPVAWPEPDRDIPTSLPEYPTVVPEGTDPELGNFRVQEQPLSPPSRPIPVYAFARVGYFNSDNAFSRVDAIDDQLFQGSIVLLAQPPLGDRTAAILQAEGGLVRYHDFPELNYTDLNLQVGIRHVLSRRVYGEINWLNRQLFAVKTGDRFLGEHSLQGALVRRDQLAPALQLASYYRLRWSFAQPTSRSRVINTAGFSLLYDLSDQLEVGINSQLNWADFTERDRVDLSTQILAQVAYNLSTNSRVVLYSGFTAGHSTDDDINLDSFIFGANFSWGVRLF